MVVPLLKTLIFQLLLPEQNPEFALSVNLLTPNRSLFYIFAQPSFDRYPVHSLPTPGHSSVGFTWQKSLLLVAAHVTPATFPRVLLLNTYRVQVFTSETRKSNILNLHDATAVLMCSSHNKAKPAVWSRLLAL